jgi:hypothetical protein
LIDFLIYNNDDPAHIGLLRLAPQQAALGRAGAWLTAIPSDGPLQS